VTIYDTIEEFNVDSNPRCVWSA